MTEETTKLADLPAQWEAEAAEIDERIDSGEVSGEVWETRRDILTENAVDLRYALAVATQSTTDYIPSSVYRLAQWLGAQAFPENPGPLTNDVCDWALALLVQQDRTIQELYKKASDKVDNTPSSSTIDA